MPSARIGLSHSGVPKERRSSPKPSIKTAPKRISKKSMKAEPTLMEKMNIKYITAKKIGTPNQRCKTILSILSVMVCLTSLSLVMQDAATLLTNE